MINFDFDFDDEILFELMELRRKQDEDRERDVYYIKTSQNNEKYIIESEESALHPKNAYYQKIFCKWDWIEIEGNIQDRMLDKLLYILESQDKLELTHETDYKKIFNLKSKGYNSNKYSNFRIAINENALKKTVKISLASSELNKKENKELFKDMQNCLIPSSVKLKRLDLSFLILADLHDVNFGFKYSKTKTTIKNTNSDKTEIETIALGSYRSKVRAILYNKKNQLLEKKNKDISVKNLYNLEITLKDEKINSWRNILEERLIFETNILDYVNYKKGDKNFAMLYLYLNDKPLFKKYFEFNDARRMDYKIKKARKKMQENNVDDNFKKYILEIFDFSKDRLTDEILELTNIRI